MTPDYTTDDIFPITPTQRARAAVALADAWGVSEPPRDARDAHLAARAVWATLPPQDADAVLIRAEAFFAFMTELPEGAQVDVDEARRVFGGKHYELVLGFCGFYPRPDIGGRFWANLPAEVTPRRQAVLRCYIFDGEELVICPTVRAALGRDQ